VKSSLLAPLCVLLCCSFTPATPPPGADELPPGAVARLGYARMVADYRFAVVSLDGKWVYSGKWFDLADGRAKKSPVHLPKGCYLERIFTDGSYIPYGNGRTIFSPNATEPLIHIAIADEIQAFDATGKFGVQVCHLDEGTEIALIDLRHGDVKKGRRVLAEMKGASGGPALSDHGKRIVWFDYSEPRALCIHDVAPAKLRRIALPEDFARLWAAISRDGKFVCCRSGQQAAVYDAASGKQIRLATGLTGDDRSAGQFTADGKAWTVQSDRGLVFVPTNPDKPIQTRPVWVSAIFPDGRRGVEIDGGGVLRVVDLQTGEQLDKHSRFRSFGGVQMLEGHRAAAWGPWGQVVIWDIRDGQVLSEASVPPPLDGRMVEYRMCFSSDGKVVAALTSGSPACLLADVRTGKILARAPGHSAVSAGFDADGQVAVLIHPTSDEKKSALWLPGRDGNASCLVPVPPGQVLPAGDGRSFAIVDDLSISLIEAVTGKERWKKDVPPMRTDERVGYSLLLAMRDARGRILTVRQHHVAIRDAVTGRTSKAFFCNADTNVRFHTAGVSASGRWLAMVGGEQGELRLFDLDAEEPDLPVLRHELPTGQVTGLALTEDGSRLISAHTNGTCLVWDLEALRSAPSSKEMDAWQALAHLDPREAQPAIAFLTRNEKAAVKLLAAQLKPAVEVPQASIAAWVKELDDENFGRRGAAEKALAAAGDQAEVALRRAVKNPSSPEQRRRAERLLNRLNPATDANHLRQVRAVEILENLGTREAVVILERIGRGAEAARLTQEARGSLARLKRRGEQ
jgi:WD40 repeat protein